MKLDGVIYIFTPVHNRRKITENFVKCLVRQVDQNFQFCLIDDGSTDGTSEMVREYIPSAKIIRGDGNLWWGGSLQEGYKWLKSLEPKENDVVLLINDDVYFGPMYLAEGRKLLEENPKATVCSQYFDQQTGQLLDRGAKCDFEKFQVLAAQHDGEVTFLPTRGLFLKATDFLNSGGFIPEKIPHYLSDYEFTFRLKKKLGLELKTSERIPVFGIDDHSGVPDVATYSPFKALKMIFSKRFHSNPVFISNFVKSCFPEDLVKKHVLKVWLKTPIIWSASFPIWFFILLRFLYTAPVNLVRHELHREFQAARALRNRKKNEKKSSLPLVRHLNFASFVGYPSFETAHQFTQLYSPQSAIEAGAEFAQKQQELQKFLLSYAIAEISNPSHQVIILSKRGPVSADNFKQGAVDFNWIEFGHCDCVGNLRPSANSIVVVDQSFASDPNLKVELSQLIENGHRYLLFASFPFVEGSLDMVGYSSDRPQLYLSRSRWKNQLEARYVAVLETSEPSIKHRILGSQVQVLTGLYRLTQN